MKKLLVLIGLVAIDQLSKIFVVSNFTLGKVYEIIPNFLNLKYVKNTGVAFSMFENNNLILILITVIVLVLILIYRNKIKEQKLLVVLTSGIIANLIDRIIRGYVVDFISFKILGINMAIFNLADTFIVVSAIIYIFIIIKEEKNAKV